MVVYEPHITGDIRLIQLGYFIWLLPTSLQFLGHAPPSIDHYIPTVDGRNPAPVGRWLIPL